MKLLLKPEHRPDCAALSINRMKQTIILMISLFLTGCATIHGKKDVVLGDLRFEYAVKGAGNPPVIFVTGLGGEMDTWQPVFDSVSEFTTALVYDRSGYGESGKPAGSLKKTVKGEVAKEALETALDVVVPGVSTAVTIGTMAFHAADDSKPRTGAEIITELHEILAKADIKPPYILVGHSLGGLYVSLYARHYPLETAGVVLVDSMHPEQIERCKEYLPQKECDPKFYPWWVRMLISISPGVIKREMEGMSETGKQIRAAGPMPHVPVVVISHGKKSGEDIERERMWDVLQKELADEADSAKHIIAGKTGHNIQKDEPDLIVNAIRDMVIGINKYRGSF